MPDGRTPPQGRFRHQPEQMVHPPFAWQLASFPSLPVCGEEAPYCPLWDFALRIYSPELKVWQAIFAFHPLYPGTGQGGAGEIAARDLQRGYARVTKTVSCGPQLLIVQRVDIGNYFDKTLDKSDPL